MKINFCILATQRTGSSYLKTLLRSHPGIVSLGELLHTDDDQVTQYDIPFFKVYRKEVQGKRPFITGRYLRDVHARLPPETVGFGFKLMYNHVRAYPEVVLSLMRHRYRIIHLVRDNPLDIIISRAVAWGDRRNRGQLVQESGHPLLRSEDKRKVNPIRLDPKNLITQIQAEENRVRKAERVFSSLPLKTFKISYEELCAHTEERMHEVLRFLDLDNEEISFESSLRKIVSGPYATRISNFDEIEPILCQHGYARLVADPPETV